MKTVENQYQSYNVTPRQKLLEYNLQKRFKTRFCAIYPIFALTRRKIVEVILLNFRSNLGYKDKLEVI